MEPDEVQLYHEVSITVLSLDVDPVTNYIIENICGGLLLEDEDGDTATTIKFYIADGINIEEKLKGLRKYLAAVNHDYKGIAIGQKQIKNLDWLQAYKESVVPIEVGNSIVIKPPWGEASFPGRVEIIIEPKMAFGTGCHESTRGTLTELERLGMAGKAVLDLGCGSGILGIYAALKGAGKVIGYDIDPLAVESSIENYRLNGVDSICRAAAGTVDDIPADSAFDVMAVNIIKSVIIPILGKLKDRLVPGGVMILAGLLQQDRQEVEAALTEHDLTSFHVRADGEWLTYTVHRE